MQSLKQIRFYIILLSVLFSTLFFLNPISSQSSDDSGYKPDKFYQTPIIVVGNSDFTLSPWTGSGTTNDPYTLENLEIMASNGPGVNITNTDMFFIISNVTISGPTGYHNASFHFINVDNGVLVDNEATGGERGFYFYNCNNMTLENNAVFDLSENSISANVGYAFDLSTNNTINNNSITNTIGSGFVFFYSHFNNITNNHMMDVNIYALRLQYSNHNLIENNSGVGSSGGHGFYFVEVNNNTIIGNSITKFANGFLMVDTLSPYLDTCNNNTFISNLAYDNFENGFQINTKGINNIFLDNKAYSNSKNGFYSQDQFPLISANLVVRGGDSYIDWYIHDNLGSMTYTIFKNDVVLESSTVSGSVRTISQKVKDLDPGNYNFTILVTDSSGNSATNSFYFNMLEIADGGVYTSTTIIEEIVSKTNTDIVTKTEVDNSKTSGGFGILLIALSLISVVVGKRKK